ncbi:MAG: PAS domain S-box protein [Bacteroidales bacterium]|nr:PAS domain S-box protein [Bacteroidales bacterium]
MESQNPQPGKRSAEIETLSQRVAELENQLSKYQQTEQVVVESEVRFRELFQNMRSCVAIYKAVDEGNDFEFLDFNRAGEKTEKITKEEVIGKRVSDVFPGVRDFGLLDVFQRVWKTGTPEHHPISQYKDGRIAGWRENYVYKLPSGEIVALYDDVTERKQAEETLLESEERFRNLFENSTVGKSLTKLDGSINVNKAFCNITGYSREELTTISWMEITHPDDVQVSNDIIKELISGKINVRRFEKRYIHKKGSFVWVDVSTYLQRDRNGNPQFFITSILDITERKKSEDELQRLKANLEMEVAEKTRELQLRISELERYHDATVEREFRIKELKDEIDRLKRDKA